MFASGLRASQSLAKRDSKVSQGLPPWDETFAERSSHQSFFCSLSPCSSPLLFAEPPGIPPNATNLCLRVLPCKLCLNQPSSVSMTFWGAILQPQGRADTRLKTQTPFPQHGGDGGTVSNGCLVAQREAGGKAAVLTRTRRGFICLC